MADLSVGDVVKLKSGGPRMTVQRVIGDQSHPMSSVLDEQLAMQGYTKGDVVCQWFSSTEIRSGPFRACGLKKLKET